MEIADIVIFLSKFQKGVWLTWFQEVRYVCISFKIWEFCNPLSKVDPSFGPSLYQWSKMDCNEHAWMVATAYRTNSFSDLEEVAEDIQVYWKGKGRIRAG
jgi:hypothetical protein